MFNTFISSELKRYLSSFPYKMEAEKLLVSSIDSNKFYHISSFEDGIKSNIFDNESNMEAHISIFNNKIKSLPSNSNTYKIDTNIIRKQSKLGITYDMIFNVLPMSEMSDNIDDDMYEMIGGTNFFKNIRNNIYQIFYKMREDEELKQLNNLKNQYKQDDFNLFKIVITNIPETKLIENMCFVTILCLFKYILSNLYFNYKNIKQLNNTVIDFNSLVKMNKTLYESMEILFFFNKNIDIYSQMLFIKNFQLNTINKLDEFKIIFAKKELKYI